MAGPTVTERNVLSLLRERVPETTQLIDEHLADDGGELLIHLLMPELLRFATRAFGSGQVAVSQNLLTFVGSAFDDGDERVRNAVQVSFVEHAGAGPGETPDFIASWPKSLLDERQRQLG